MIRYNFNGVLYKYEPEVAELSNLIYRLVAKEYKIPLETAEKIVTDLWIYDACEERYEEDIKDYFELQAYEECFEN